ncbi:MAG: hypothetical protein R2734_02790 [Nocardioides sp.]
MLVGVGAPAWLVYTARSTGGARPALAALPFLLVAAGLLGACLRACGLAARRGGSWSPRS